MFQRISWVLCFATQLISYLNALAPTVKVETTVGVGRQWGFQNDPPVQFTHVEGMDFDRQNKTIYICDTWNNCVRKYEINTGITSTVAGICDYYANGYLDGPASSAKFDKPHDVKMAPNGDLYVADAYNNCIRKVSKGQVTTAAGQCGTAAVNRGYVNGIGTNAMLSGARRLIFDTNGYLVISDTENNCIRKMNITTREVSDMVGQCGSASANINGPVSSARLSWPYGLAINYENGEIYFADTANQCIKRISSGSVSSYSGLCSTSALTVDGPVNSARFNNPIAIVFDNNFLFVSQNNCIRRVSPDRTVSTWAGTCGTTAYLDGYGTASNFWAPTQLSFDPHTNSIYVTDSWNYAIRNVTTVCPQNSILDKSSYDCICPSGFTLNAQSNGCSTCATTYYKSTTGFQSCSMCPSGTESAPDRTSCVQCPSGKYRSSQAVCVPCPVNSLCTSIDFQCNPGYKFDSSASTCVQCPSGQFKNVTGNSDCSSCSQNSESSPERTYCISYDCPSNGSCPQRGIISCLPGFELANSGKNCTACRAGFIKPTLDTTPCLQCGADQVSNTDFTACRYCVFGMFKDLNEQKCIMCPDNYATCSGIVLTCETGFKKSPSGTQCIAIGNVQEYSLDSFLKTNSLIIYIIVAVTVISMGLYITYACFANRYKQRNQLTATVDFMSTSTVNPVSRVNIDTSSYKGGQKLLSDADKDSTTYNTAFGNGVTLMSSVKTVSSFLSIPAFLQFEGDSDFTADKYLTSGGGGKIYIGTACTDDTAAYGKKIIVKKIHSPRNQPETDLFYQELSIMYMLREHPNIAKLVGFSVEPYFAVLMRYYVLGSLEQWLQKGMGSRSKSSISFFIKDICEGVAMIHRNGLAHSDLKPANILLDTDASGSIFCVLTDFGIARIVRQDIIKVQAFRAIEAKAASLAFASPETLRYFRSQTRTVFDPQRADIYSTAVIMTCLITGDASPWSTDRVSEQMVTAKVTRTAMSKSGKSAPRS